MAADTSDNSGTAQGSSTTIQDVLQKSQYLIRFDLQYSTRATSATPDQLSRLAKTSNTTTSEISLSGLRSFVSEMGPRDHFCLDDDKHTIVGEDMTLMRYLSCTPTNTSLLKNFSDTSVAIFTIFLAKSRIRPTAADLNKLGSPPPVSLDFPTDDTTKVSRDSAQLPDGWKTGTLSPDQFAGVVGSGQPVHPADMTEKEWDVVVKNNILTHAYRIDFSTNTTFVARRPAFKLKRRPAEVFVVSADSDKAPDSTTVIPEFRVFDDSSVTVVEITNEAQKSAAENSFSSLSIQASASGGVFGITAGGSAGFKVEGSEGTATSTGTFQSTMQVSYKFPRVLVFLDHESLEPSEGCLALLKAIDAQNDTSKRNELIQSFRNLYGDVFSAEVQLGGILYSTKLSSAIAASTVHEKMDRLKVSAGVNFSAPSVSGSASIEYGKGSDLSNAETTSNKYESLTWTAKGGDTLLCSNPPYWSSTVQDFYNWRVIERSYPNTLAGMLKQMDGCEKYASYLDYLGKAQGAAQGEVGSYQFDDDD